MEMSLSLQVQNKKERVNLKLKTAITVFAAIVLLVGVSAVLAMVNGSNHGEDPLTGEEAEQLAREFLLNSATFKFDGLSDTAELSIVRLPADPDELESTFTYTFQTAHYGHGDRSDLVILPVVTDHVLEITVAKGRVISAICCGTWDEINSVTLGGRIEDSSELTARELDPEEAGIQEGFVIDISDSRILVVSEIKREEALQLTAEK